MSTFAPAFNVAGAAESLSAESLPPSTRITVAGAGAFGGWTALHLLRLGFKVKLFDPWGAGNSLSSSGGETRLMRSVYGRNAFYTQLANESYDMWLETESWENRKLLQTTGNLWLVGDDDEEMQLATGVMDNLHLAYQIFTPDQASKRFPYMDCSDLSYVMLEEKTGVLKARESCQAVLRKFVSEGGIYEMASLQPGDIRDGKIGGCKTSKGETHIADIYLFAGGPWLKTIFPEVLAEQLTITRQEIQYFGLSASKASIMESGLPSWIDMASEEGYYGVPGGYQRGFKVASDKRGPEVDPTLQERSPSLQEVEKSRNYIHKRFPGLGELPLLESRVCQYSNTKDGGFILDKHPDADNVWLIGGGSGHGFKHGPALGKLAARVIGGQQGLPTSLSLSRFK